MENLYFIMNPTSAAGKCKQRFEQAREYLESAGITGTLLETTHSGHGAELAQQAVSEGAECITVVGGDGSIREIASVIAKTDVKLCIFPFGSGNDFARALNIPTAPTKAAEQLISGSVHEIDAASVNDEIFMNVAGFGFDVEVLVQTEKYKKRMGGQAAYVFGLLQALLHLRPFSIKYSHDGEEVEMDSFIATVGNGKYIGGGMAAHPRADEADGLLDVCIIESLKKRKVPAVLLKFLKGKHLDLPVVRYFRTKEITIECAEEAIVQLDGELIEKTPAMFKVHEKAVKLIK